MAIVLTIAGSPSIPSRSSAVLEYIRTQFEAHQYGTSAIQVRDLPAEALLWAQVKDPAIERAIGQVEVAQVVVIATPVYKAAYTGILKAFLDLLPQKALADKIVFPIATGGSPAHQLSIDYALKPVLSALGAQHVLTGLYIQDSQIQYTDGFQLDPAIHQRLHETVESIVTRLTRPEISLVGK